MNFVQWIILFSSIGFVIVIGIVGMLGAAALMVWLSLKKHTFMYYGSKTKMIVRLNRDHIPVDGIVTGDLEVFMNSPLNPSPGTTPPKNTKFTFPPSGPLIPPNKITWTVPVPATGEVVFTPNSTSLSTIGSVNFTISSSNYEGPAKIIITEVNTGETIVINLQVQ